MADLQGGQLLTDIENSFPKLGLFLRNSILPAINALGQNAAVAPVGKIAAPAPPESVNVTTAGEYMQVTVNHSAPIQKGVQYLTHISTNPQFSQPIVHDHGASRSPAPFPLPTKDATGANHSYYVGTVAQYPGSDPSPMTYYGGSSPAPITMGGTTQMALLPSTGSGTGSNSGQQSGVGLGTVQMRPAVSPKRNLAERAT